MIQANELRIGNYILHERKNPKFGNDDAPYGVTEVKGIDDQGINRESGYDGWLELAEYENVYPIPLTEEWLLKLGFEPGYFGFVIYIDMLELSYNTDTNELILGDAGELIYIPKKVLYVHELQNFYYSLVGKELKINPESISTTGFNS